MDYVWGPKGGLPFFFSCCWFIQSKTRLLSLENENTSGLARYAHISQDKRMFIYAQDNTRRHVQSLHMVIMNNERVLSSVSQRTMRKKQWSLCIWKRHCHYDSMVFPSTMLSIVCHTVTFCAREPKKTFVLPVFPLQSCTTFQGICHLNPLHP